MKLFQLKSYDTWGNAKDGYEVDDISSEGIFWQAEELPSFKDIIACLKRCEYLKPRYRFNSQYPYEDMEVIEYKGKPIAQVGEVDNDISITGNWFTFGNFPIGFPAIVFKQTKKGYRRIK
jgi:hypothetical protein